MQVLVEFVLCRTKARNWGSVGVGGKIVSPKRQAEAHQVIIDTLRQTGQTSHDVVPDGKGDTSVESLCLWPATPEKGVAGTHLQLTLFRESGFAEGSNIHLVAHQFPSDEYHSGGTRSLPETSPPCADNPPTLDLGLGECGSAATSTLPEHTLGSDPSELNSAVPTLTDDHCPLKSCLPAPSFRPNTFDTTIAPRPLSPCLSSYRLDVPLSVIPSHGEPSSLTSTIPTSPDTNSLPSPECEQLDPENVPVRSSPPQNTDTSSEYQSRIATYLRPLWSYPGVPLSPPIRNPPPPSEKEDGRASGCSASKSFLCEKDLSEALSSLMPPSTNFTQLDQAISCCTGLRYPPALAVAMSLLPVQEGTQVTVTYNSSSSKPNGCRARDQGFLEIDASHFGPTSFVGALGSPPPGAQVTFTVEDINDPICSSSVAKTETSGRGTIRRTGLHCGSLGRAGRPRRPASRYTPETKRRPPGRPFKPTSMRGRRPPGGRLARRLPGSESMEGQLPLVDSLCEPLWIDPPDDCVLPPCQHRHPSPQNNPLLLDQSKTGTLPVNIHQHLTHNYPGPPFCSVSKSASLLSTKRHLMLLAGDAVRLIALALRTGDPGIMDTAALYLTVCQHEGREALLNSIRVRTPGGLKDLPPNWTRLFSPKSCLRNLRLLRVVPCPPDSMLEALSQWASVAHGMGGVGTSWNLCCTPTELCEIIMQVASSPPNEPSSDVSSTCLVNRDESSPVCINSFLSLHPSTNVGALAESVLLHLSEFVPTRLLLLSRALRMDNDSKAIGGIGLICRVFRRLYTHLFLPYPSLRPHLLHEGLPSGTVVICGTLFTHIKAIHTAVADCLARLRDSYASLVSAGACLSALHRLRCARGHSSLENVSRTFSSCHSHGTTVNPLDEGRSRLFDSAVHARQNVARILYDELSPCLMRLLFAVSGAYSHLVWVVMNDLFMFRSKRGIQLRPQPFAARSNNACCLMDTGMATLNFMDRAVTENPDFWCSDYRDVLRMCKAQFNVLKQPGLLNEMNKLLVQLKDFRCSLRKTRYNLKKQWCPAFRGQLLEEEVDCRADQDIKLMTTLLQYQFDLVEKWSRSVHNIELPPVARNMVNIILRLADSEGRKAIGRLSEAVPETLEIPYGSKNAQSCDWFGCPFELPSLCEWPPGQPNVNMTSFCDRESDRDPPVINLESPLKSVLADECESASTLGVSSIIPFIPGTEMGENEDRRRSETEINASTKRYVSIETPLIPETRIENQAPTAIAVSTLTLSSDADRRLLGRQNRVQKMRDKEHKLNDAMKTVPPNSILRKSTLTPAGRAARGKRMSNGSVDPACRAKRFLHTNEPTGAFNSDALSPVLAANVVDKSAAQLNVLSVLTEPQAIVVPGARSGGLFVRPPPAVHENSPSTIDLTVED
ncbi:unnamed protein product [Schistocephalus solidus]|uniref:SH2 domain-containing protein n=1 Tax=Schistocephalus solidus TaxID=70667 RepID=A0A183SJS3_SCHSO|nr:unnamed protein product [Schistocephalus solidus]